MLHTVYSQIENLRPPINNCPLTLEISLYNPKYKAHISMVCFNSKDFALSVRLLKSSRPTSTTIYIILKMQLCCPEYKAHISMFCFHSNEIALSVRIPKRLFLEATTVVWFWKCHFISLVIKVTIQWLYFQLSCFFVWRQYSIRNRCSCSQWGLSTFAISFNNPLIKPDCEMTFIWDAV